MKRRKNAIGLAKILLLGLLFPWVAVSIFSFRGRELKIFCTVE